MKITKSELKEMIREALREELNNSKKYPRKKLKEDALHFEDSEVPEQTYVILTDDGPVARDVFLTWDADEHYYTTVDYVEDIDMFDCHDSVAKAEARAKDADSGTWGGWPAPMHIIKITNFKDAYLNGEEPEYTVVKTLDFAANRNSSLSENTTSQVGAGTPNIAYVIICDCRDPLDPADRKFLAFSDEYALHLK